jgi:hypothetical protein
VNKESWQDTIKRELNRERIEPASEDFYRGIWSRIKAKDRAFPAARADNNFVSIGLACWRSLPVFATLLLIVTAYAWFYPPDSGNLAGISAESYVLDSDNAPSTTDLLYQIMHSMHFSELETKP